MLDQRSAFEARPGAFGRYRDDAYATTLAGSRTRPLSANARG